LCGRAPGSESASRATCATIEVLVTRRRGDEHVPVLSRLRAPDVLWTGVIAPLLFTTVYLLEGATDRSLG
jgi:hypothetical protein